MNRFELFRSLMARGLSPLHVYIDGARDDGWPFNCLYLVETPEGWQVGGQERNVHTPYATYPDEADAAADLFERLRAAEHWPEQSTYDAHTVPWSPRMLEIGTIVASRVGEPLWDKLADAPGRRARIRLEPPMFFQGVPGAASLLRPGSGADDPARPAYALTQPLVVTAALTDDGDLDLRLGDGETVEDLVGSDVLRRVVVVAESERA